MNQYDLSRIGVESDPDAISISSARELVRFLQSDYCENASLVECRRLGDDIEIVIFDVEASVPQRPVHDIKNVEPVAAIFSPTEDIQVDVWSLRTDFPYVPHTNLRQAGYPRSLCLYDQPRHEVEFSWTAANLIAKIVWWLERTAHGVLHEDDQPLEPLLFGSFSDLIVPRDFLGHSSSIIPHWATAERIRRPDGTYSLEIAKSTDIVAEDAPDKCFVLVATSKPTTHGLVRHTPNTLAEFHDLLHPAGINIIGEMMRRFSRWPSQFKREKLDKLLQGKLLIILRLRKRRMDRGAVETVELRAFESKDSLELVGEGIGIRWDVVRSPGRARSPDAARRGARVGLKLLNVREAFSRDLAAQTNGFNVGGTTPDIAAIGVGALGSQVVTNLVRSGFGRWALVDEDTLQPHNLGRHALGAEFIGHYKSQALSTYLGTMIGEDDAFRPVVANILAPYDASGELASRLKNADLVLDMAASVPVSRRLARDVDTDARRVSLFLNPSGNALTLLAEDTERHIPLDSLEMQFYRHLVAEPKLHGLLEHPGNSRTGLTCRDVSAQIPQDFVAIHAGTASRAVHLLEDTEEALIRTWILEDQLNYRLVMDIEPASIQQIVAGGWEILLDSALVRKLSDFRKDRLPNETGGVLLGSLDNGRKIIYIADALPSPPDSQEKTTSYIRGVQGLEEDVRSVNRVTGDMLVYVGEWHSHPARSSAIPSNQDKKLLKWVCEGMRVHGQPGLILVVGDNGKIEVRIQE